ncbi:MAG: AAA family ATPase [Candidatus Aminicenantes bacterium]|nr:MAG: AAA family ATPase [Candidatus Aminicenantes bacterium]
MTDFKLESLRMKNFKVFDDFSLYFESDDLVVFGGPNGFGKTTVFDAMELALTGKIERFHAIESYPGCKDVLVAKDQSKPVAIELVVARDDETYTIVRKLKEKHVGTSGDKNANRVENFSKLWDLFLKKGNGKEKLINQKKLEESLGQKELNRYYNLFYYIQQEDTSHFLKKSERERLEEISRLFGTAKEEDEQRKLISARRKIASLKRNIERTITEIERSIEVEESKIPKKEVPYASLLTWAETKKEWDKKELFFSTPGTKDKYIYELMKIQSLVKHRDHFLARKEFEDNSAKVDTIKALIVGSNFKDRCEEIEVRYKKKKKLVEALDILKGENLLAKSKELDIKLLSGIFPAFDFNSFFYKVRKLQEQKKNLDSTGEILGELVGLRSEFLSRFKEIDAAVIEKKDCPLCGCDWKKPEDLLREIDEKTFFFNDLLTDKQNAFQEEKKQFNHLVKSLKEQIRTKLETAEFSISGSFYNAFKNSQKLKESSNKLIKWLDVKKISYVDLLVTEIDEDINDGFLNKKVRELKERINSKAPALPDDEYQVENEKFEFIRVFNDFFNGVSEKLKAIDQVDIDRKKEFIERQYFHSLEEKKIELETKLSILKEVHKKLTKAVNIYQKRIGQHRNRITKNIEIPFFIYSGKILQAIREINTTGVFIKDPLQKEEIKNIRFVTDWKTDHDVINTTSSGQLAGIVMALTLAMNRIYSTGLSSIFIDDPVRTMDDVNMISLVELLRNDFTDKQLFLSTHEGDIEKYIIYKYLKYGLSVRRINLMTERFIEN